MTKPVSQIGGINPPPSTSLTSSVAAHICNDTLKDSAENAARPLVGMDPKIETLMISAKEKIGQAQQLPVCEEEQARQTFNASINEIQVDLEKVYIFAQKAHSTQLKVFLFMNLLPCF
ncbi:MAG TPA: hypothetical protein VHK67_02270 [Rhabdochlamydiaceae bacterium]|jgi:hypothetical protein|nr:hypothetical protein [Rhabdochlamydiaceae bacterium]